MALIDEMVADMAHQCQLPPAQAGQVVASMLRFLGARLPSPLFGQLQARLQVDAPPVAADTTASDTNPDSPRHSEP